MKIKNINFGISLFALVIAMLILSFASVPLYSLFCKVTGYGGTTGAMLNTGKIGKKIIKVRFDANIEPGLEWKFKPEQREVSALTGQNILAFYSAKNFGQKDIVGMSIYNVTPHKAGIYFNKIHCFCFEEQLLKAGEEVNMPVSYFIDPAIEDDENLKDVNTITLSYTFFKLRNLESK